MNHHITRTIGKLATQCLKGLACLLTMLLLALVPMTASVSALDALRPPSLVPANLTQPTADSSYWIWLVLPRLFPEYLPEGGGYLSLGFAWIPGHETPVGITKTAAGPLHESRQHLDCLGCHTVSASAPRSASDIPEQLSQPSDGAIVKTAFVHAAYADFLNRCAQDPRFDADYVLPFIRYNHKLSLWQDLDYRWRLIPQARRSFLALASN